MPRVHAITASVRRQAAFLFWMANLILAMAVGVNYLFHLRDEVSVKAWFFALPALVSTALMLTLLPGALFILSAHYVKRPRVFGLVQATFWTVFQVALFTDTRIYNMFRYHVNGQVLNLIYVRGSEDAIHLGWQVWTAITLGLSLTILAELWVWRWAVRRARIQSRLKVRRRILLRPALVLGLVLLPTVFLEKTMYAQADLARDRQITQIARLFPLYARVPMEDFASRMLGVDVERPPKVVLQGFRLDYPHARPAIQPEGPLPDVLVLVIDCMRKDRLSAEYSPNVTRWSERCRVFDDHLSGGNSTRYGLFSLIYGLHGSYWFPVLESGASPVLIDSLNELGYEFGIFGSASMNYPELRETAWSAIEEAVHDDFPAPVPWRRDELAADAMIAWLEEEATNEDPLFGFILLDSPHQTYSHPPDGLVFQPSAPEIDYMMLTRNEGPEAGVREALINRYNNAVYHADDVAGRVLAAIEKSPRYDNTIVVVTSDHGEEFWECGFFGHTSAYTEEQIAVPFLMSGPGITPGLEERPTSHLDFPPTLLEMLGANPAGRETWCLGENLLEPRAHRQRVVSAWNELGVWTSGAILRVPLSLLEFDVEAYDYRWNPITDDRDVLRSEAETLERLGAECNRFLE